MLSLGQCLAAGKLSYGSRTGMTVTIIEMSGIDTAKAIIKTQHTREDARLFCTDYLGRPGDECIDKVLSEIKISDSIRGDCNSGQFVNLSGQSMLFAGPNLDYDAVQFSPEYKIFRKGDKTILDGSSASGYGVNLEQYGTLCPSKFNDANRLFANRPKYVGRWYFGSSKVCGKGEGEESLLVYKTREFVAVDTYCVIKGVRVNGSRYHLTMTCNAEGESIGVERQTVEVSENKMQRSVMVEGKPTTFTYIRCPF
ncbi:hypothetical protein ACVWZV_009670 [Bradyrhizobium sp. GM5.1]